MKNTNPLAAASRFGSLRVRPYKVLSASLFAFVLFAFALTASAQVVTGNQRIVHTITKQHTNPPELGRDYWFAPIQNYQDQAGKYYRLYITSPNNTNAFVESQGIVKNIPVPSYGVGTYTMPLDWEMKSSGVVEDKGIHVYDPTDDICVYMMSHNPYTSDGARIIPTTGWGTDYVVVGYEALFEGGGTYVDDFPSEFSITADQDNTLVEITPSSDFRQAAAFGLGRTTVAYPQGKKFSVVLNRGQSVQYQTVAAQDADNYDVTGTIVHSNVGVDIMAGSCCPNIPPDFPYCDEVCDQVPPTRTWAETYYTTNPAEPAGATNKDQSLYCMISSKPGQTIWTFDPTRGARVEAVLGPTYDHYYDEQQASLKWYSDAPFLLFQYLNSASYPDMVNGNGDPADCPITPAENFTQTVVFEAPTSVGAQAPYDNYANIIANVHDLIKRDTFINGVLTHLHGTLFDGKSILTQIGHPIDDTFEVFTIPHVVANAHVIQADSGFTCGVYIYGYGYDESYMWGGGFGNGTFHSPDTVAPNVVITGECFNAYIHLTDSGYLPGSSTLMQSGLNEIRLDSDVNMAYQPVLYPNWVEGGAIDTSGYGMFVVDETKPALLLVDVFDAAGNETTIRSTYIPQTAAITPPLQDFGVGNFAPAAPVIRYDTLTNLGKVPFKFTQLSLKYGNRGFTIISPNAPDSIPVGGKIPVEISFSPVQQTANVDSVIFGDPCLTQVVALIGSGGAPDFYVADVVWLNVPLHPDPSSKTATDTGGWVKKAAIIHNLSKTDTLHVSNTGWLDQVHFAQADTLGPTLGTPQTFPVTVPPAGLDSVWFWYQPTDLNRTATQASWTAPEVLESDGKTPSPRYDSLIGNAITPTLTFTQDTSVTLDCPDTSIHSVQLAFILTNSGDQATIIGSVTLTNPASFTGLTLHDQHAGVWDPNSGSLEPLPAGAIDTVLLSFPVASLTNMSGTTQIFAKDVNGNLIGDTLNATVNVNYWAYTVSNDTLNFDPAVYQAPAGSVPTQTITITNTASSELQINSLGLIAGGGYNTAFGITEVPSLAGVDSVVLAPGATMTVTFSFNPGFSSDSLQQTRMQINANSCSGQDVVLNGHVMVYGAFLTNFTPTPILACDTRTDTIQIKDGQASDEAENAADTVASTAWLLGSNNFSIPNIDGVVINGNSSLPVAVTFKPDQTGNQHMQMYGDSLQVVLHRVRGGDTTLTEWITGIASSFNITATSAFGTDSTNAGGTLDLPIKAAVDNGGLNVPLTTLGITEVVLTYNVQNPGLVTPQPITNLYPGWNATFTWNPVTGVLIETLTSNTTPPTPLDDGIVSAPNGFGIIPFKVYLDATDNGSNVTLSTMQLMNGGVPIGPCVGTSVQSGAMSLILKCGDSTLRLLMSGKGALIDFVNPATPDPVSGGQVTFSYANRGSANITLTVLDVLGHEVMRPLDNVYHDAGSWQTTSDVTNLPSGTYTYRLSAGGYVVSKQFVIQR